MSQTIGNQATAGTKWRPWRKPKLDPRITADLRLYGTDDLRHEYHRAEGGSNTLIRLRDGNITREEITTEILQRIWMDRFAYMALMAVAVIGTIAAVIAAVEGWRW